MSFEMLREAYRRVRARAPKGTGPLSRADVYLFVFAAGEFGDALAGAGLYAALKKEAERFVDWVGHVAESNRDFSFQKEGWYLPFTANREVGFTYILAPIISETYMGYVEYHDAHFDTEPKASEGLGHYLLYVCSIAREAEMQEPHFFEHLVDACLLVGPRGVDLVLRAADKLCDPARVHSAPLPLPLGEPEPSDALRDDSAQRATELGEALAEAPGDGVCEMQEGPLLQVAEGVACTPIPSPVPQSKPPSVSVPADEASSDTPTDLEVREARWREARIIRADAQPPQAYYGADYLEGSLKALSLALYTDSKTGDPKVVMRAVMNEQVWVKRISRHGWQMFFHTQRDLERGRGKMERKLAENGQHGPKEN